MKQPCNNNMFPLLKLHAQAFASQDDTFLFVPQATTNPKENLLSANDVTKTFLFPEDFAGATGMSVEENDAVLMCMFLRDEMVETEKQGRGSCGRYSSERMFERDYHMGVCEAVVLPFYLSNGNTAITCSTTSHRKQLGTLQSMYQQSLESNHCPSNTSLASFKGLLHTLWDDYVTKGYEVAQQKSYDVDGRVRQTVEALFQSACYHIYHYVPFTPTMTPTQYWSAFASSVLSENEGSGVFDAMVCMWQSTANARGCGVFFEDLKHTRQFEGRDVKVYDFDYLHVLPAFHLVSQSPQQWEVGFPFDANRRYALNIQAKHRGEVFGCLIKGLFGGARILARGVKVGGLHATNTQRASVDYKQTDNMLIYTNSMLADEVETVINLCKEGYEDPEGVPMLSRIDEGVFEGDDDGKSFGKERCKAVGLAVGKMTDYKLLDMFQPSLKPSLIGPGREAGLRSLFYPIFEMFVMEEFVSNNMERCLPHKIHQ